MNIRKKFIGSIISLVLASFAVVFVVYAWFTLLDTAEISIINEVNGFNLKLDLYVYHDSARIGAIDSEISLINNIYDEADINKNDQVYELITNPAVTNLFDFGTSQVQAAPGDRFSFAIGIENFEKSKGSIVINLTNINNVIDREIGDSRNDIRYAFKYMLTRAIYINGDNEIDIIDVNGLNKTEYLIDFAVDTPFADENISPNIKNSYNLISGIKIDEVSTQQSHLIVFFDVFFDPIVSGYDGDGNKTFDSNHFKYQMMEIKKINVLFNPNI